MRLLIPVLVVGIIVLGIVVIVAMRSRVSTARKTTREYLRHEEFLARQLKYCISMSDVNPFASLMADEIRTHLAYTKEIK